MIHPLIKDDDQCSIIDQPDGNISLTSSNSSFCNPDIDAAIPVHTGYRPFNQNQMYNVRLPPVRKTIRRDNKVPQALSLPKLTNYNVRSLLPKVENFGINMENKNCSLSFKLRFGTNLKIRNISLNLKNCLN